VHFQIDRAGRACAAVMLGGAVALFLGAAASAQAYAPGDKVQASPSMMEGYWQPCVVLSGPGPNGYYQLNCAANPLRDRSLISVPAKWMKPAAAPLANGAPAVAPTKTPGRFAVGSTVLAAPSQIQSEWERCVVVRAPDRNGYYGLECADQIAGAGDKPVRFIKSVVVPGTWMKPDDPGFRPEMQIAKIKADVARKKAHPTVPAPRTHDGAAGAVALGSYECWSSNRANLTLNFVVTGSRTYRASDGSNGTFAFDPGSKNIAFTGYLKDAMPKGFSTMYHEPKGHPTVSFQARGGEAAFCEKV
jgi:hypothetical protein